MNERQNEIVSLLKGGSKSVTNIAKALFIGEMTVRRELKSLEKNGIITRYRGLVSLNTDSTNASYDIRRDSFGNEKAGLAARAAEELFQGALIFMDGSTTCAKLLPFLLRCKPSAVVTNSLKLAEDLSANEIKVKILPGDIVAFDRCVVGSDAVKYIGGFNFDLSFLSAKGLAEGYITDNDEQQTQIRREVIEHSARSVFLMDNSKLGRTYSYVVAEASEVTLITAEHINYKDNE